MFAMHSFVFSTKSDNTAGSLSVMSFYGFFYFLSFT